MLHSIQQRYGEKLRATDGEIGHVRDFYLDDKTWTVRYLVADTGGWLRGRLVLISPHALGRLYPNGKVLLVNLTRRQIEKSPSIDEHKPVSRQHEEEYHRHYGYPYYAQSWPLWGLTDYPVTAPPPLTNGKQKAADSRLRSARFIKGYKVVATDGVVGEVADFMIDGRRWVIREIVVQFGPWYAAKAIRIPTDKITRISYDESTVNVNLAKDAMADVNEGEVTPPLASSNLENLSV
jgi:sporulation protein YlmC with PRC-barrel domain